MHTCCSVLMKLPFVMQQQEFCLRGGCEGHVEFVSRAGIGPGNAQSVCDSAPPLMALKSHVPGFQVVISTLSVLREEEEQGAEPPARSVLALSAWVLGWVRIGLSPGCPSGHFRPRQAACGQRRARPFRAPPSQTPPFKAFGNWGI